MGESSLRYNAYMAAAKKADQTGNTDSKLNTDAEKAAFWNEVKKFEETQTNCGLVILEAPVDDNPTGLSQTGMSDFVKKYNSNTGKQYSHNPNQKRALTTAAQYVRDHHVHYRCTGIIIDESQIIKNRKPIETPKPVKPEPITPTPKRNTPTPQPKVSDDNVNKFLAIYQNADKKKDSGIYNETSGEMEQSNFITQFNTANIQNANGQVVQISKGSPQATIFFSAINGYSLSNIIGTDGKLTIEDITPTRKSAIQDAINALPPK